MGRISRTLDQLTPERGKLLIENLVQWTTQESADLGVQLATLAHFAASKCDDGAPGSAQNLIQELEQFHQDHLARLLPSTAAKIPNPTFTAFRYAASPQRGWRTLPARFLLWLADAHDDRRFSRTSIITRLLTQWELLAALDQRLPTTARAEVAPRSRNLVFYNSGSDDCAFTRPELELIASRIALKNVNSPEHPEYPLLNRRFPATPTHEINVDGRPILIKDESALGTGTHKDRMAHEVIAEYARVHIPNALAGEGPPYYLPRCSMISSGSAALALQIQLDRLRLPNLHVLHDEERMSDTVAEKLRLWGAVLFPTRLGAGLLSSEAVKRMTLNDDGIDLTLRDPAASAQKTYYDWLSYEILNLKPRHIFVPVGTGELFANLIQIVGKRRADLRLTSSAREALNGLTIWGATTDSPTSHLSMLYAPYRPALSRIDKTLAEFKQSGQIGAKSGVLNVDEQMAEQALQIVNNIGVRGANRELRYAIRTDASGIAGLALYLQQKTHIAKDETVVVVNTGCLDLGP